MVTPNKIVHRSFSFSKSKRHLFWHAWAVGFFEQASLASHSRPPRALSSHSSLSLFQSLMGMILLSQPTITNHGRDSTVPADNSVQHVHFFLFSGRISASASCSVYYAEALPAYSSYAIAIKRTSFFKHPSK